MTVAFVAGIPLGTFIGQHFGWRATFLVVALFGLVAFVGAVAFVPRGLPQRRPRRSPASSACSRSRACCWSMR